MKRSLLALCLVFVATGANAASGLFSFYGAWKVDALVGYSEISVGEDQLRGLIGKQIVIGNNHVKVGDDDCKADNMRVATRATKPILLREYKAGPKDARVPARTLVLDADPCGYVFRAGDEIVFSQDGGFYRASRLKP
jgi:hypothetical protein